MLLSDYCSVAQHVIMKRGCRKTEKKCKRDIDLKSLIKLVAMVPLINRIVINLMQSGPDFN